MYKNIYFIGLGIIGGSIAKKIREVYPDVHVYATAATAQTIEYALAQKIIDGSGNADELAINADLIIIAVPIDKIPELVQKVYKVCSKNTVIIDVGSTKQIIWRKLKKYSSKFIGGHPMFGKEKTGIAHADHSIISGAKFVLTPYTDTPPQKLEQLKEFLTALGFTVLPLSPEEHDISVAAVSHLPYFTAAALTRMASTANKKSLAATGFQSSTRVAASDPRWGVDIAATNKKAVLRELANYQKELTNIKKMISTDKLIELQAYLAESQSLRKEIYE